MKTKAQKRTEAKKKAEELKAQRKLIRDARAKSDTMAPRPRKSKGKSFSAAVKKEKVGWFLYNLNGAKFSTFPRFFLNYPYHLE